MGALSSKKSYNVGETHKRELSSIDVKQERSRRLQTKTVSDVENNFDYFSATPSTSREVADVTDAKPNFEKQIEENKATFTEAKPNVEKQIEEHEETFTGSTPNVETQNEEPEAMFPKMKPNVENQIEETEAMFTKMKPNVENHIEEIEPTLTDVKPEVEKQPEEHKGTFGRSTKKSKAPKPPQEAAVALPPTENLETQDQNEEQQPTHDLTDNVQVQDEVIEGSAPEEEAPKPQPRKVKESKNLQTVQLATVNHEEESNDQAAASHEVPTQPSNDEEQTRQSDDLNTVQIHNIDMEVAPKEHENKEVNMIDFSDEDEEIKKEKQEMLPEIQKVEEETLPTVELNQLITTQQSAAGDDKNEASIEEETATDISEGNTQAKVTEHVNAEEIEPVQNEPSLIEKHDEKEELEVATKEVEASIIIEEQITHNSISKDEEHTEEQRKNEEGTCQIQDQRIHTVEEKPDSSHKAANEEESVAQNDESQEKHKEKPSVNDNDSIETEETRIEEPNTLGNTEVIQQNEKLETKASVPQEAILQPNEAKEESVTRKELQATEVKLKEELPNQTNSQESTPQEPEKVEIHPTLIQIREIEEETKSLMKQIDDFKGASSDSEYYILNETLIRDLLKLDDLAVEGNEEIKKERKRVITFIQQCLNSLEDRLEKH